LRKVLLTVGKSKNSPIGGKECSQETGILQGDEKGNLHKYHPSEVDRYKKKKKNQGQTQNGTQSSHGKVPP